MSSNINLGLLAHVDAGKTTLSEAMLYLSGTVRKLGRVDHQDAFLDTDTQERERGITIFSKQAELKWNGRDITLLDTPGHADFSGEAERTLRVLDCAVLLISGADGVQGHTLTLWRLLQSYRVPTFIFVNKMDQPGVNRENIMAEIKNRLSDACVDMISRERFEEIATTSEEALSDYLESGTVPDNHIGCAIVGRRLFPCYFGSALHLEGIGELLNALTAYFPGIEYPDDFAARVYKITRDPQGNRLTWLKVTGGELKVKTLLHGLGAEAPGGAWEEKVNQLRFYSGARFRTADAAPAGAVCAVTGLSYTRAGDGLGMEKPGEAPLLSPVFTCRVLPGAGMDIHALLTALRQLEEEEGQLHVLWNEEKREIHVQLMGDVQLEILRRILLDRFRIPVDFGAESILYRETIGAPARGVGHYEPLRHYAEVHLLLEPLPRGSGLRFESACSEDVLERSWQRLILTHLMEKPHLGVLTGSPLTDVKITLVAGRAHLKHTEGGDFRQATYRAVRQALMGAQSVLLEPWYDMTLDLPLDAMGRALNDIRLMGGRAEPAEIAGDRVIIRASASVFAARGYGREVTGYTRGRGQVTCVFRGYEECANADEVIALRGYDAERDISNPADSVFCAHGAGYVVPWQEVPAHAHLQPFEKEKQADEETAPAKSSGYRGTAAEDEELKAIFERTYGEIKPRVAASSPKNVPTVNNHPLVLPEAGPEILLVDGYNVIFSWEKLKDIAKKSLEDARHALIEILCDYHGFHPCELILVFDAYRVPGSVGAREDIRGIHIIYTREAETADNYIEKTIYHMDKKCRIRVATSDGTEQLIILGGGALRISSREFEREVLAAKVQIDEILRRNNDARDGKTTLGEAVKRAEEARFRES